MIRTTHIRSAQAISPRERLVFCVSTQALTRVHRRDACAHIGQNIASAGKTHAATRTYRLVRERGETNVLEGQIYQPTILSNVPPDIAVANEETLGGKSHGSE